MTDQGTIRADLVSGTVEFGGKVETFEVNRDYTYIAQHQAILAGENEILCTLNQGLDVMRMIDAAEAAAVGKIWVAA